MATEIDELKNVIETALFSATEPLTVKRMQSMFPEAEPSQEDVAQTLTVLQADYASRGIELARIGDAYRFRTRVVYAPWLRRLANARPPRYSRALLETLAIIAYRQPVTRGDIEEIRGVGASTEIMRTLLEREWIKEVGARDAPGRPALFGTTRSFLEYFGLESLRDLPPLRDERDIGEIASELNLELPETATTSIDGAVDESDGPDEANHRAADLEQARQVGTEGLIATAPDAVPPREADTEGMVSDRPAADDDPVAASVAEVTGAKERP